MVKRWLALLLMGSGLMVLVGLLFASQTMAAGTYAGHEMPAHGTPAAQNTPHHDIDDFEGPAPTYFEDVEPILQANCMSCHLEGGIGYATFPMDDVAYVTEWDNAEYIGMLTAERAMPPWPPGPESAPLMHERTLDEAEINLIQHWVAAGAPLGDESQRTPFAPPTNMAMLDVNVEVPLPVAYMPDERLDDDYRCFLIDPGFEDDLFMTGYDFRPDNTEIAHHALVFLISDDMVEQAVALDEADRGPGWQCFGDNGLTRPTSANEISAAFMKALANQNINMIALFQQMDVTIAELRAMNLAELQLLLEENGVDVQRLISDMDRAQTSDDLLRRTGLNRLVTGWAPGMVAVRFPPGTGLFVPAGSQMVVQMHYNLFGGAAPDQSTILLETMPFDESVTPVLNRAFVAPVEIPCPASEDDILCRREIAKLQVENVGFPDLLLAMCGQTQDTYASNTADNAHGYCDYQIPLDGWIIQIGGHMHERGTHTRIVLNPDTSDAYTLLDIPYWDFHWQGTYSLVTPVEVTPEDVIRVECWWDNSDGDRYVVWGEGTQDEMCFNPVAYIPRLPGKSLADYGYTVPE